MKQVKASKAQKASRDRDWAEAQKWFSELTTDEAYSLYDIIEAFIGSKDARLLSMGKLANIAFSELLHNRFQ